VHRLDFYADADLEVIVRRSADPRRAHQDEAAAEIARRSRGTPRIANRLLRRVRDYAQVRRRARLPAVTQAALAMLEVDDRGFDEIDALLRTIIDKFGAARGRQHDCAAISEEKDAIEDIYEPF